MTETEIEQKPITEFRGEHRFLSNFWPCRVFNVHWYPTVEHAYQAAKCDDKAEELQIREADSPGMAKRLGGHVRVRPDWDQIKLEVMADLLWQKFVLNPEMRKRLLATGTRELVEGNTWGDTYWGKCCQVGENHLGRLIMQMRDFGRYLVENGSYSDGRSKPESTRPPDRPVGEP